MLDPGSNPSKEGHVENALYQAWKDANPSERPEIEASLLPHLRRHAAKVCWMVLHSNQLDYVEEVAQDVIMELDKFRGDSAFSTWVHSRALNRFRVLYHQIRRRREVVLDTQPTESFVAKDISPETRSMASAILEDQALTPHEREFLRLKFVEGLTVREMAERLNIHPSTVGEQWLWLRKRLRSKYAH